MLSNERHPVTISLFAAFTTFTLPPNSLQWNGPEFVFQIKNAAKLTYLKTSHRGLRPRGAAPQCSCGAFERVPGGARSATKSATILPPNALAIVSIIYSLIIYSLIIHCINYLFTYYCNSYTRAFDCRKQIPAEFSARRTNDRYQCVI